MPTEIKPSYGLQADMDDCVESVSMRLDEIKEWYVRIREMKDYRLPQATVATLMTCVGDAVNIAEYFRKLRDKEK